MKIPGTQGYETVVQKYILSTETIPFEILHRDYLTFLPANPSLILDLGAGPGRDAYELVRRGHQVIAVEPLDNFRQAGQQRYPSPNLRWIKDALPDLSKLDHLLGKVDFILSSGVWHHLDESEQFLALERVAQLLKPGGQFAVSLRNGPAGAGTHVFPTRPRKLINRARSFHLNPILTIFDQPSLMKHKAAVKWAKLVFKKMPIDDSRD